MIVWCILFQVHSTVTKNGFLVSRCISLTQLTEKIGFFALKTQRLIQVPSQQSLTQLVLRVDNSLSITKKDCKELYILTIILDLLIMTFVKWKF